MRKLERMGRRMFDWLVVLAVILSVYSAFNAVHAGYASAAEIRKQTERCGAQAGQVIFFARQRDLGLPHAHVREAAMYAVDPPGYAKTIANIVDFVYKFPTLSRKELAVAWFDGCLEKFIE